MDAPSGQPPQAPKSAADIEKEQEALLAKKYGGLAKKKLMPKERNYFDSADWALSKQGKKPENIAGAAPGPPPTALPPKLEPSDHLKPRRSSHLGDLEAASSFASSHTSS
jgi:hypothetical protein